MKWCLLLLLIVLQVSCTTLANRRDLYSPEPGPGSRERGRQLAGNFTTARTRTTTVAPSPTGPPPEEPAAAMPQFR